MSIDVVVANSFSTGLQTLQDQDGAPSALAASTNTARVTGQDIVGGAMPFTLVGQPVGAGQQTWGRLVRLVGTNGQFFDLGIDSSGNLFLNGPNSSATGHILSISQSGVITFSCS